MQLQGLGKRYGRRRVFRDIKAEVQGGQVLVVTGPNGSGKSTLLRILAGLERPSEGQVQAWVGGQSLSQAQLQRRLGLVAADVEPYGELTALENLSFFARVRTIGLSLLDQEALLAQVGLAGRGHDLVQNYSCGMRQRLKFACAMLHRPLLLLLDEPGANLDKAGLKLLDSLITRQRKRGLLVLATNDPRETAYADCELPLKGAPP
ncbi:MAG: ABC transporter ATP-binding protein [Chloroflexia bacterium]|nr:ABC transporter ATP-binding protein [Chloroflexia bacterium]